jgi:hypothetical protein
MFAVIGAATGVVATVNVPVVVPAEIVTVARLGTVAKRLSLAIPIVNPPLGATLPIVTVALLELPPVTVDGERAMLTSAGGVMVNGADAVALPSVALIFAVVDAATGDVETVNVAVVWPTGIVTVAGFGTVAEPLSLATEIANPPAGAALLMVTVAVLIAPPVTADGESDTLTKFGGAIVNGAVTDWLPRVAVMLAVIKAATG